MTLSEFKAWFSGFTESMEGAPTEKQWERIKARVAEISGQPITRTVYVDRYIEPYRRYWGEINNLPPLVAYSTANTPAPGKDVFDGYTAMLDLGKAEYASERRSIS